VKIEDRHYSLDIEAQTGAARSLMDKASGLELIAEPRLAESFRLLLPLPDLEANYILGTEQSPPVIEETEIGACLRWDGPLTNANGRFDLSVSVSIELSQGEIRSTIRVENRAAHALAEVWHAGLGGLMGLGNRKTTRTLIPDWGVGAHQDLFQRFPESMGVGSGGGMRFPEFYVSYPNRLSMPWMDIYSLESNRGVYYACHDPTPRVNTLRFEMHPGLARNRLSGNWPSDEEIEAQRDDYPPGLIMHWVHMPYTRPGGTFESPPVVLRFHEGDWHTAAGIYRSWFRSQFPVRGPEESWLRKEQAVQDAMFLLPEGNVMLTFKDIPRWAKGAKHFGAGTVMISGWNVGGHDNQYPDYTPDPRLGTWEELEEAIQECHRMGVRVLFFTNIQAVDCSTRDYESRLHRYRVMNARGQTRAAGWGMGTLGARIGLTCPPISYCDPGFPEYREEIVERMRKLAEIGADGVHYDKVGAGDLDFNPDLPLPVDQAHPTGIIKCMEETLAACRAVRPDFCLGVESHWDRMLSYCDAWWLWYDMLDHVPVMKYTFPEFFPTFAVVQPWDYNNVNNAVRYGYQLLVGPVRYSASMSDEQSRPISTYIREVGRIREELKETILFGDFLDDLEVTVEAGEHVKYSTHRHPGTGKRACVLVNLAETEQEAEIAFEGAPGPARVYRPFEETQTVELPATLSIPGERLAIIVEE